MITKPVLPVQQATCVAAAVAALKTNFLNNQKGFKSELEFSDTREVVFQSETEIFKNRETG